MRGRTTTVTVGRDVLPILLVVLLALSLVGVSPARAATTNDVERAAEMRFVDHVNAERASRGLPRLSTSSQLRRVARDHSREMAARDDLYHNQNLGDDVSNWWRLAENVGYGPSVHWLHTALMDSDGHRHNILDDQVTQIGVGVEIRDGVVWVTQVFRQPQDVDSFGFADVGSGTHARNILTLASEVITGGCSAISYCPHARVTRAQMATFLARAMAANPSGDDHFVDVDRDSVHWGNVNTLAETSITEGCRSRDFCPGQAVTREQMATFLGRALGLEPISRDAFGDVAGSAHAGWINAIERVGITDGCGWDDGERLYCPNQAVTRAQMATFLVRAFEL